MKGGKSGSGKIIAFYYQMTEVFKLLLNIRQHAGSKNDRK